MYLRLRLPILYTEDSTGESRLFWLRLVSLLCLARSFGDFTGRLSVVVSNEALNGFPIHLKRVMIIVRGFNQRHSNYRYKLREYSVPTPPMVLFNEIPSYELLGGYYV